MDSSRRSSTPLLRRPNGRPQACEPCRKRKVACDHAHPVCRRCQKSKRGARCEYIIDPQMSIITPTRSTASLSPPSSSPTQRVSPSSAQTVEPTLSTLPPQPPPAIPGQVSSVVANPEVGAGPCGPGYLGFTSHNDIYEETQNSLSLLRNANGEIDVQPTETVQSVPAFKSLPSLSPRTLRTCLDVLRTIPQRHMADTLFAAQYTRHDAWIRLAAQKTLDSMYNTFERYLGSDRSDSRLVEMARIICSNTSAPFSDDEPDPEKWLGQYSGQNLRWESIGMLFVYWEMGAHTSDRCRKEITQMPGYKNSSPLFRESISLIIELSRMHSDGNTLLLYILFMRGIGESLVAGDAAPSVWRYHGEAVSLLTFLGLHDPNEPKPYKPTLATEAKRKLFATIFNIDKVIATFTGRPPLMSRRYMPTTSPLDLNDEDLLSSPAELAKAVERLDENGWDPSGRIGSSTIIRARMTFATLKDELFEIALGHGQERIAVDDLLNLRERQNQAMADIPPGLKYNPTKILNRENDGNDTLFSRILIHLEHLQNLFFIYRLLNQRGADYRVELIQNAFEMVSISLLFWTHGARIPHVTTCLEWLVIAYAAPPGGILCQELLKPTTTATAPTRTSGTTTPAAQGLPTRFAMIEKLFLLVGFLDWVSPEAPNGDLCCKCKMVIRRVLEQATDSHPRPTLPAEEGGAMAAPSSFEAWNWGLGATVDFDFDLLDTFDFLRPEPMAG